MSRRGLALGTAGGLAAAAILPSPALAHGLVGRADLPIPAPLFGWAAAIVLVVSFLALGALWKQPRLQRPDERPLFRIPAWVDVLCGAVGVAVFCVVVYAGLDGVSEAQRNLAPTFVYVLFWVGLVVLSVLFGDVFRAFNPWRAVGRAMGWGVGRVRGAPPPPRRAYPEWLGYWPAMAGILGFAWLELAYVNKADPRVLGWLAIGYAAVQLAGMAVFGAAAWSDRADAFGVYFGLFGRLAPLTRRDGVLHTRPPLSGAPRFTLLPGAVGLLCAAIGSTTFDGFSNGPVWASARPHLEDFFGSLGAGQDGRIELAATLGLAMCVLVVAGFYRVGVRGMETVGEGHGARELAGRFVHTLIPIAFAYALAHYFSLLVVQGQAAAYLISDPLGDGSNLFGTAKATVDQGVVSSNVIWYVQVGALITGHVCGLILAHDRALAIYRGAREAVRSQYWMLVVMVGFTSLGLWLLSAVNQ
ncbi:MAG: hypothetical protein QOK25_3089 [Thermoleophilaceae bacterium]|jgi:hypothetical protein|nr:hypothetical protein [Thermoleophilaceae bacterium]